MGKNRNRPRCACGCGEFIDEGNFPLMETKWGTAIAIGSCRRAILEREEQEAKERHREEPMEELEEFLGELDNRDGSSPATINDLVRLGEIIQKLMERRT